MGKLWLLLSMGKPAVTAMLLLSMGKLWLRRLVMRPRTSRATRGPTTSSTTSCGCAAPRSRRFGSAATA
eukprot:10709389-Lingulodinium_polyedra.AAC.1